jgi:hypothetical protein
MKIRSDGDKLNRCHFFILLLFRTVYFLLEFQRGHEYEEIIKLRFLLGL